jgi:hypothetical protein
MYEAIRTSWSEHARVRSEGLRHAAGTRPEGGRELELLWFMKIEAPYGRNLAQSAHGRKEHLVPCASQEP